jgi:tetratricopeptide (TPR) repeat protein
VAYEKLEHYDLGFKYYQKAIKLDNFNDEAWFGAGMCLNAQDKWYESIHFLNKALKFDPENSEYWTAVAETEYKLGNIVSSLDAWEEVCLLDPENK